MSQAPIAFGWADAISKRARKDLLACIRLHGLGASEDPLVDTRVQFIGDHAAVLCVLTFLKGQYPIKYVGGGIAPRDSEYTTCWPRCQIVTLEK